MNKLFLLTVCVSYAACGMREGFSLNDENFDFQNEHFNRSISKNEKIDEKWAQPLLEVIEFKGKLDGLDNFNRSAKPKSVKRKQSYDSRVRVFVVGGLYKDGFGNSYDIDYTGEAFEAVLNSYPERSGRSKKAKQQEEIIALDQRESFEVNKIEQYFDKNVCSGAQQKHVIDDNSAEKKQQREREELTNFMDLF